MSDEIDFDPNFVTASIVHLTDPTRCAFDIIVEFQFISGEKCGPFFRLDGPEWKHSRNEPKGRWAGLAEPLTKKEAYGWYCLDKSGSDNPKIHVHEFFIKIPEDVTEAVGFLGKVKKGTGFQIKLSNIAVEWIQKIGEPKELE